MKKITTLKILLFSVGLFACTSSFAQTAPKRKAFGKEIKSVNPNNGLVRCISDEYENSLQQKDAKRATNEQFEKWIAPYVENIKSKMLSSRNSDGTAIVINIPVVVHVIHNGDAVGTNENITDARVLSQITVLNQDFRKMLGTPGYNTNAVGADIEIQFCMAQRKPDGTATTGVDRVLKTTTNWSSSSSVETMKTTTQWDPTQYFNIWTVQFTSNQNLELGGVLGYAQFPSASQLAGLEVDEGSANTDGVVIDWRCFGSSTIAPGSYFTDYDKGRTATHEIGHCFGLRHIWGDVGSQQDGVDCSGDDYCADTPTAGWENYDCLQVYNSCPAPGNDMVENYMDYTNDTCMNIFTLDQKARIQAVLLNSPRRNTLGASLACQAPLGTPSFELLQGLKLYPNPAKDVLNIAIANGNLPDSFVIYNNLGQVITQAKVISENDLKVNTSNFSAGIYMIRVSKDNDSKTLQFIKN